MFRGFLLAAFTVFVWGVTFVNTKALLTDFSALEIQVLRFGIATLALWLVEKAVGGSVRPTAGTLTYKDELVFAGMGFFGVAAYQLLENCAIHYTRASNVSILVSINPVVTALLACAFAHAKCPKRKFFVGFFVAIVGVAMVSINGIAEFHFRPIGDIMAVGAMLSWGGYSILVDKINAKGLSQVWVMRRVFMWSLLMIVPFVAYGLTSSGAQTLSGSFAVTLDASVNVTRFSRALNLINLGFLGFLASAACFVFWNKACSILGVVRCTVGLYLIPAVTVLFAFCCLGEHLTIISSIGAVLTLVGVVISDSSSPS